MQKTIICNIPMRPDINQTVYTSDDMSIPVSDRKSYYPISPFLEKTLTGEDEVSALLLVKKDKYGHYDKNVELFKKELEEVNAAIGADITYTVIDTEFKETRAVHELLLGSIVDALQTDTHIIADITYGPKDLPIVLMTALNFAENYLRCTVDNIIYGQASFLNGKAVDTKICDMIPLYCLGSITNMIHCKEPEKAREMLKTLLDL